MGLQTVRTSDVSGAPLADDKAVKGVIRNHPDSPESKRFDLSVEELATLKTVTNLVEVDLTMPDGSNTKVFCTKAELAKLLPDDKLKGLPNARGREPGFRPQNGNGH